MLELLYCILVGTGALCILFSIFYGIAMLFHKGKAEEETDAEMILEAMEELLDYQENIADLVCNMEKYLFSLVWKHGDLDCLDTICIRPDDQPDVPLAAEELLYLKRRRHQEDTTDEEAAT